MKKLTTFLLLLFSGIAWSQKPDWEFVQWACEVKECSHQYSSEEYSPSKTLGLPDTFLLRPDALKEAYLIGWNEKTDKEDPIAWVKVAFCSPQKAKKVVIAESHTPGCITRVSLFDEKNKEYEVYAGEAKNLNQLKRLWEITFPLTSYLVTAIKIEAKPTVNAEWNVIDAIGISEESKPLVIPNHLENLGFKINTDYSELKPKISSDGKTLYFSRFADPNNMGYNYQPEDQDIWFSELDEHGNWTYAKNMGRPLNNEFPNWPISISPDEQSMVVSGKYDRYGTYLGGGLSSFIKIPSGAWGKPAELTIRNYKTLTPAVDFFLSNNKNVILLSINPKTGSHNDIYFSILLEDGTYSEPKSIGNVINTPKNEFAPFLASDNITLYFSSNGHGGYGGNDIFMSRRLDDTWQNWSPPMNLGIEVNSSNFDSDFSISAKGDYAYLVSNNDSYGKEDIVRVKLKDNLRPHPVAFIKGRVLNKKTNQPIGAEIIYELLQSSRLEGTANSDSKTGAYKVVLPYGKNYSYRASAKGFYPISENLDLTEVSAYQEIEKDLYLVPIEKGETFRLNNLFFDTAKYDLLPTSNGELNRLVDFLKINPKIKIEISGHTDNVGTDESNITLSDNRAQAVVKYLVEKGINSNRLSYKGYGEIKPEASNETEEGRQYNRRVSFTILEN